MAGSVRDTPRTPRNRVKYGSLFCMKHHPVKAILLKHDTSSISQVKMPQNIDEGSRNPADRRILMDKSNAKRLFHTSDTCSYVACQIQRLQKVAMRAKKDSSLHFSEGQRH